MKLSERLTLGGFKAGWLAGRWLPEQLVRKAMDLAANWVWRQQGRGVLRLTFNLARVQNASPRELQIQALAKQALANYFRYWAELFLQSRWSDEDILNRIEVSGLELVEAELAKGRSVMLLATHSGNWDLVGAWGAIHFNGFTTVGERLEPVELFDEFVRQRSIRKIEILPHKGGPRRPSEVLLERLQSGKVVALAADRDMSRTGVEVQMFGHTAKLPGGPAFLAAQTNCAIFPIGIWFEGAKTRVHFYPELPMSHTDAVADTQLLADAFSKVLAAHPECWSMLQQVWLDHPVSWGGRK